MDATICLLLLLPRSIEINNNPHVILRRSFSHWSLSLPPVLHLHADRLVLGVGKMRTALPSNTVNREPSHAMQ
jgi:hypothetical protein